MDELGCALPSVAPEPRPLIMILQLFPILSFTKCERGGASLQNDAHLLEFIPLCRPLPGLRMSLYG